MHPSKCCERKEYYKGKTKNSLTWPKAKQKNQLQRILYL